MCIRWFRDSLSGEPAVSYRQLEEESAQIEPGSEGLLFIPHFSGRVLPSNPSLKGAFLGLDFKHSRGHMFRAVMEAVAYEYKYYLSILRSLYPGNSFNKMLSIGGGAKSPLFNQIKADVLGVPVTNFETGETALLGSAVIAAVGVGLLSDYEKPIQRVMRRGTEFTVDLNKHEAYIPYGEGYLAAIDQLTPFYNNFMNSMKNGED
jgi:xylulokinase